MLFIFLAAALPAIILFWYVYSRDINPEPTNLVLKGFLFGALSTFASTLISGPLMYLGFFPREPSTIVEAIKVSFFGAAIPEESAKLLMLWLLLRNCREFDERYDGLVYAAAVGLGFATFENLLYLLSSGFSFFTVAISRAFLAVPGHFAFAIIMGYYYSKSHFSWDEKEKKNARWKMWFYPVLLHGIYDSICYMSGLDGVSPLISIALTCGLIYFCAKLFQFTRNRIIAEAADNAAASGYYADHSDFYTEERQKSSGGWFPKGDLFGKDLEYYYKDGDNSIDEQ